MAERPRRVTSGTWTPEKDAISNSSPERRQIEHGTMRVSRGERVSLMRPRSAQFERKDVIRSLTEERQALIAQQAEERQKEDYLKLLEEYKKQKLAQSSAAAAAAQGAGSLSANNSLSSSSSSSSLTSSAGAADELQGLRLTILSGWNFPVCNPFCVVKHGQYKKSTKLLLKCSSEPRWNETFLLEKDEHAPPGTSGVLLVECWNKKGAQDVTLGQVRIDLATFKDWGTQKQFLLGQNMLDEGSTRALRLLLEPISASASAFSASSAASVTSSSSSSPGSSSPVTTSGNSRLKTVQSSPAIAHSRLSSGGSATLSASASSVASMLVSPMANFSGTIEQSLRVALEAGEAERVVSLLRQGGSFEPRMVSTRANQTLLHMAAAGRAPDLALTLLDKGAFINTRDTIQGWTAMHLACSVGATEVARVLADAGADLEERDQDGNTPLHLATASGHLETVRFLFSRAASPSVLDRAGRTVVHKAVALGQPELFRLVLERAISIVNTEDLQGTSPLLEAELEGKVEIADQLLARGGDPSCHNRAGDTLVWAGLINHDPVRVDRLLRLYPTKLSVNTKLGSNKWTLLHRAVAQLDESVCLEVIPFLIQHGIEVDARSADEKTALFWAAARGARQVVKLLLYANANVNAADKAGNTPLHFVSSLDVAKMLVQKGAKANVKTKLGNNPLHTAFAFHSEKADLITYLQEKGADPEALNKAGLLPRDTLTNLVHRHLALPQTPEDSFNSTFCGIEISPHSKKEKPKS